MAIEINGKIYRNLQEQVQKNKDDIEELQESTIDAYSKEEADDKFATKSDLYGDFYTRDQADDRFPTETHMNLLLGYKQDRLTAGTNISIDENNVISSAGNTYTAGNGININNDEISVDTNTIATVATLQSFTQTFGGEITSIYNGTSTVGKARQDALGRTINEYYAGKTDITDYYAGTNVYFNPHSGAAGYDISVPIKTINGNSLAGTGDVSVAALTEDSFRVNVRTGNPTIKTWYYTFRAEATLDTTKTGMDCLFSYVPVGAILYCPDDNCLYSVVSAIPNGQTTIAKYDGTTTVYLTPSFVNTNIERL